MQRLFYFPARHITLLIVLVLPSCGPAGGRPTNPAPGQMVDLEEKKFISAPGIAGLEGFSQAVKVGKRIYLSGTVGVDAAGNPVGVDLGAQATRAFQNLQAILLAAGGTPEDVVQLDLYIVNPTEADLATIRQAGSAFFPAGKAPAGNLIGVQSLPREGLRLAIGAVAETRGLFPDREALRRYQ
jgi:2-iminobutanoate/2-iminopropanoate deaminase